MAQQLNGKLEAGNLRRLPVCELVELRGLVFALDALADQIGRLPRCADAATGLVAEVVPVTAPTPGKSSRSWPSRTPRWRAWNRMARWTATKRRCWPRCTPRCPRSMGCWCGCCGPWARRGPTRKRSAGAWTPCKSARPGFARQAENYRAATTPFLDALGLTKWRHAEFSVSVSAARPGVVITDEAALPDQAWRVERKIDKAKLRELLEAGEVVPGAELANGIPTMTVRTK